MSQLHLFIFLEVHINLACDMHRWCTLVQWTGGREAERICVQRGWDWDSLGKHWSGYWQSRMNCLHYTLPRTDQLVMTATDQGIYNWHPDYRYLDNRKVLNKHWDMKLESESRSGSSPRQCECECWSSSSQCKQLCENNEVNIILNPASNLEHKFIIHNFKS